MSFALVFDIAAACVLAFFAVRGLVRGFSGEVVGLAGFLVAMSCSWPLAQKAAEPILKAIPDWDPAVVALCCTVAIFFGIMLVFALIDKVVGFLIEAAKLSLMDHALGILVGALKTGCIVLFAYGVLTVFPFLPNAWMKESYVMRGAAVAWPPASQLLEAWGILDLKALTHPEGVQADLTLPVGDVLESADVLLAIPEQGGQGR